MSFIKVIMFLKNCLHFVFELLVLVFVLLLGRMYGHYEVYLNRGRFHIVSEVNPRIGLVNFLDSDCQILRGSVEGRFVRLIYRDQPVIPDQKGFWEVSGDKVEDG